MALKPTIYKFDITLSDLDRQYYDALNLTVAQHPSESVERMMARVLVYCLNADPQLEFTQGVSAVDQPDIWQHTLDGQLTHWIDIGEPSFERMKKATRQANTVKVYALNTKADVWWQNVEPEVRALVLNIYQFQWRDIQTLASYATRTMSFSVTIADGFADISTDQGDISITWDTRQATPPS